MEIIETKQLPIDEASKLALIDLRTAMFDDDVAALAERLYTGDVSIGQWEEFMKKLIRELHASTAAIARGGWDNMTWEDWGRLGPVLKDQYRYLHGFADYIAANRDTMSIDYLKARAKMYDNAVNQSMNMMTAGLEISNKLPWLPGDMSTECDGNCKCHWELAIIDNSEGFNTIRAIWRLSNAEHCDTCVKRNGFETTFELFDSIKVPSTIGHI